MKLPSVLTPADLKKTFIAFIATLAVQAIIVLLFLIVHG